MTSLKPPPSVFLGFLVLASVMRPAASAFAESRPGASAPAAAIRPVAGVLEIVPLKLASEKPQILFQTNAVPQETVFVTIRGRSGEILRYPSYYGHYQLQRKPGELPVLDLSHLPRGLYQIEAKLSGSVQVKHIFIGKKDESFDAELSRHLKQISNVQQSEKKALFHTAAKMESLVKELNESYRRFKGKRAKWATFYKAWQKKVKVAAGPVERLAKAKKEMSAYPEEILALRSMLERLQLHSARLDAGISQSRDIASEISALRDEDFAFEFKKMKSAFAQLGSKPAQ